MEKAFVSLETEGAEGYKRQRRLMEEELSEVCLSLPEGTTNIRLQFEGKNRILYLKTVQGVSSPRKEGEEALIYDLSFSTNALRLGHNLFLLEENNSCVYGEDFRFGTIELRLQTDIICLSDEEAEALSHAVRRKEAENRELEEKWLFQRSTYDEKVQEVERLEADKVELNETIEELRGEVAFWRDKYHEMEQSSSWRLTAPIRSITGALREKKAGSPLKALKRAFVGREGLDKLKAQYAAFPEEKAAEAESGPVFALYVRFTEEPEEVVLRFAATLLRQTWQGFFLYAEGKPELITWLCSLDERIVPCSGPPKEKDFFLSFLSPGDLLMPKTLEKCALALRENPGAKAVYTDSAFYGEGPQNTKDLWFKPDFSPDYLMGMNYIRGFYAAKGSLLSTEEETDLLIADKAYGYILLTTAGLSEAEVCHVRERLFYEKEEERTGFVLEKENPLIEEALRKAAQKRGWPLQSLTLIDRKKSLFHPTYSFDRQKLISVVIPNKDHGEDLAKCIDSLKRSAEGYALEILIVENNSAKKETFELYRRLEQDERIRVLQYRDRFNFSRINNFAVKEAKGELLLLLNNDMTVLPGDLLGELLMYAERPDVGAVGAKLLYPDNTIQHAGVIIGLGGVAAHSHKDYGKEDAGYMNRLLVAQNLSAVTAACLMMRKAVYEEIDGMDPGYEVAFNDADFCMRIRKKGYRVVFTPFARLTHYESKSRGTENTPEKAERFESEVQRFKALWPGILRDGDPYYNPNLTTASEDFSIRPEAL